MSELAKTIDSGISSDDSSDWRVLREALHEAHGAATSIEERVAVLKLYKELMDHVAATQIVPGELLQFNETRAKDYRLFLVREGLVGDNACVETLDEITRREIAAGRMSPDDELRQVTLQGLAAPHASRAELEALVAKSGKSFWARLFSKR